MVDLLLSYTMLKSLNLQGLSGWATVKLLHSYSHFLGNIFNYLLVQCTVHKNK